MHTRSGVREHLPHTGTRAKTQGERRPARGTEAEEQLSAGAGPRDGHGIPGFHARRDRVREPQKRNSRRATMLNWRPASQQPGKRVNSPSP